MVGFVREWIDEFRGDLGWQGHRQDHSKSHQKIGWKYGVQTCPYSSILRVEKLSAQFDSRVRNPAITICKTRVLALF